MSARDANKVRRAQTEVELVPEVEQDDKNKAVNTSPEADFPFKLNDLFGYCT